MISKNKSRASKGPTKDDRILANCQQRYKSEHHCIQTTNPHLQVQFMLAGLGGYSHKGWAWRYYLPKELKFRASNNLLEHLAAVISLWVNILANQLNSNNCILLMTDSTTAEGWSKKSNFSELGESPEQASARIEAARMHTSLFLKKGIKTYSQWFKGEENNLPDALSCNNNRSDNEPTLIIKSFCPSQVPSCFKILQLPKEIISFLTTLLRKLPVKEQLREEHTRSKVGRGEDGRNMPVQLALKMTSTSSTSHKKNATSLLVPLPWLLGTQDFQDHLMNSWLQTRFEIPSSKYVQPSRKMDTQTQLSTMMGDLLSFYNKNLEHLRIQTQKKSTKKQSLSQSSAKLPNKTAPNLNGQQPNLPP